RRAAASAKVICSRTRNPPSAPRRISTNFLPAPLDHLGWGRQNPASLRLMCFWRQGEEGAMRFEVTTVLDAIERHLTTEAALAQVAVDIGEIAWFEALDGGRPVNLLRTGLLVDALARHFGEDAIRLYPVAGRDLLTDADLTSKERMVLG